MGCPRFSSRRFTLILMPALISIGMWDCTSNTPETPPPPFVPLAPAPPTPLKSRVIPTVEPDLQVGATKQVLNHYFALTQDAKAGDTQLVVNDYVNPSTLEATGFRDLKKGHLLLLIQMQGAIIDPANSIDYGFLLDVNHAGQFEFVWVKEVDAAHKTIILEDFSGGLQHSYAASSHVQAVWVPLYKNLTIQPAGSIAADFWDGSRGGIVAVQALHFTVNGFIDVFGAGFRGGKLSRMVYPFATNVQDFVTNEEQLAAEKGEGIAGTSLQPGIGGRFGRGALGNGGGGGNSEQGGGGGGANGNETGIWDEENALCATGQGVMEVLLPGSDQDRAWQLDPYFIANHRFADSCGGGRGGYTLSVSPANPLVYGPENPTVWLGDGRREHGGLGGYPVRNDPSTQLYLGGGGGAGAAVIPPIGEGGLGGGIVYITAGTIQGNGVVNADGSLGNSSVRTNDNGTTNGGGGGGAGGTVILRSAHISGILALARGGNGGNQIHMAPPSQTNNFAAGPGGGGGGGYIAMSTNANAQSSVNGGRSGITNTVGMARFPENGATRGNAGQVERILTSADLEIETALLSENLLLHGTKIHYQVRVSNHGPDIVLGAQVTGQLPFPVQTLSWTCRAQGLAQCSTASGNADLLNTSIDLGVESSVVFDITVLPSMDVCGSGTYQVVSSEEVLDRNPTNNQAQIPFLQTAPLLIHAQAVPNPAEGLQPLQYQVSVQNSNPGCLPTNHLQVEIGFPGNAHIYSIDAPGWACFPSLKTILCLQTPEEGQFGDIIVSILPPPGLSEVDTQVRISMSGTLLSEQTLSTIVNNPAIGGVSGGGLGCNFTSSSALPLHGLIEMGAWALFLVTFRILRWNRRFSLKM